MKSRYDKSVRRGDMAGRQFIYPIAQEMILEKPVVGWGPINEQYELGHRTRELEFGNPEKAADRKTRHTHNLVLEVLTSTGLAGAIPLFTCIGLCLVAGWKARIGPQGILPFALSLVILMVNMTVPLQAAKQGWMIFAYALAFGGYSISKRRPRRAGSRMRQVSPANGSAGSPATNEKEATHQ
jgi:O-antigen ligase